MEIPARSLKYTLCLLFLCFVSTANFAEDTSEMPLAEPIRLDPDKLNGKGLDPLDAPWPKRILVHGVETHRFSSLFAGQMVVSIYEADDGLLKIEDYPFDEFVHVLNGQAILTADGGKPQTFKAGDSFVVPKGFTGTWEMQDNFREMIVIEKEANAAGLEILFAE